MKMASGGSMTPAATPMPMPRRVIAQRARPIYLYRADAADQSAILRRLSRRVLICHWYLPSCPDGHNCGETTHAAPGDVPSPPCRVCAEECYAARLGDRCSRANSRPAIAVGAGALRWRRGMRDALPMFLHVSRRFPAFPRRATRRAHGISLARPLRTWPARAGQRRMS